MSVNRRLHGTVPANEEALKHWLLGVLEVNPALLMHLNGQPLDVVASGARPFVAGGKTRESA